MCGTYAHELCTGSACTYLFTPTPDLALRTKREKAKGQTHRDWTNLIFSLRAQIKDGWRHYSSNIQTSKKKKVFLLPLFSWSLFGSQGFNPQRHCVCASPLNYDSSSESIIQSVLAWKHHRVTSHSASCTLSWCNDFLRQQSLISNFLFPSRRKIEKT